MLSYFFCPLLTLPNLGGALIVSDLRPLLDELKVEKMIVCQQFIRSCSPQQLRELIDEAIKAFLDKFGGSTKRLLKPSLGVAEKRRREEEEDESQITT